MRFDDESGKEDSGKPKEEYKSSNPLFIQIEHIELELEHLKSKPYEHMYEELMLFLEVHDPQKFR